jgi:hypothetical protein
VQILLKYDVAEGKHMRMVELHYSMQHEEYKAFPPKVFQNTYIKKYAIVTGNFR